MSSPFDITSYDPLDTFGFEALAVAGTAVGFTAATMADANAAFCTVEVAPVRMRADGTDPTATVGTPFAVGDRFVVWGDRDLKSVRFIRQGSSATLSTHFAKRVG